MKTVYPSVYLSQMSIIECLVVAGLSACHY